MRQSIHGLATEVAKDQASTDRMNNLDPAQFDRTFLDMMVNSHNKALEAYRSELSTVQNADLKDYLNDMIPTIEKHLNRAEQLQSQITTGAKPTRR